MNRLILLILLLFCLPVMGKPTLVIVVAETHYQTPITLPPFCQQNLSDSFDIHVVTADPGNPHLLQNAEIIAKADLLLLSIRRRALPPAQLNMIRKHIAAGKPVAAMRTASHGFAMNKSMTKPAGHETWDSFDGDVLGGSYHGHGPSSLSTTVTVVKAAKGNPLIRGVDGEFSVRSWLYYVSPIAKDCQVLLEGSDGKETHPVAWTRTLKSGSRVFYTSLGHPEDFEIQSMRSSLVNGICWAAGVKVPNRKASYAPYAAFVEADFPFLTSIVDAGVKSGPFPAENLTVRGLILKLSSDVSACFDTDLCRLAAVWRGGLINSRTMAPNSYAQATAGKKAPGGFGPYPPIVGAPISALGMVAGVGTDARDPRPKEPYADQPGRGPISPQLARWSGIQLTAAGPVLHYTVNGRAIREMLEATADGYLRHFSAFEGPVVTIKLSTTGPSCKAIGDGSISLANGLQLLSIPASFSGTVSCSVAVGGVTPKTKPFPPTDAAGPARWPEVQSTRSFNTTAVESNYQLRDIPRPVPNPWRRSVRTSGIDFFADGRAAIVTYDGDVWLVDGLDSKLRSVKWKRFASGLYEPLNLSVVDGKIYVFHRNEITRLHDYDTDGTADYYENFCNIPVQSPESREFPLDIVKRPGGGFFISKGGQQNKQPGIHGGTVLAISADGRQAEVIATHTREGYLGIHPKTGYLFGSDQQGHYTPATPIYGIEAGDKFGFALLPKSAKQLAPYHPTPPIMWLPHRVLQSGAGLLWPTDPRLGPLYDRLLCLDYYKPGLGVVLCDPKNRQRGGAAYRIDLPARSGLQHAAINPKDGLLYMVGFQIWGSTGKTVASFSRLEPRKGPDLLPTAIEAYQEGVRIAFHSAIDADSLNPAKLSAERWNYLRSKAYGSPHFKLSGDKGQDQLFVQSLTRSKDGKSVFIRIADMRVCMQMQIAYDFTLAKGAAKRSVWLTPSQLPSFRPKAQGFGILAPARAVTLTTAGKAPTPTAKLGVKVAETFGCIACHSNDGTTTGRIGPSWKALSGSTVTLADGKSLTADAAFLRESILEPTAKVRKGYDKPDAGMPSYAGVLKPHELEAVLLYIDSLK